MIAVAAAAPAVAASLTTDFAVISVSQPSQPVVATQSDQNVYADNQSIRTTVVYQNVGTTPIPAGSTVSFTGIPQTVGTGGVLVGPGVPNFVSASGGTLTGHTQDSTNNTVTSTLSAPLLPGQSVTVVYEQLVPLAWAGRYPTGVSATAQSSVPDTVPANDSKASTQYWIEGSRTSDLAVTSVTGPYNAESLTPGAGTPATAKADGSYDADARYFYDITYTNNGNLDIPAGVTLAGAAHTDVPGHWWPIKALNNSTTPLTFSTTTDTRNPATGGINDSLTSFKTTNTWPAGHSVTIRYEVKGDASTTAADTLAWVQGEIYPPAGWPNSSTTNDVTRKTFNITGPSTAFDAQNITTGQYGVYPHNGAVLTGYGEYKNNGPGPIPAGTTLRFGVSSETLNDPTITSHTVPGGISAPTSYLSTYPNANGIPGTFTGPDGTWVGTGRPGYAVIDVQTLQPIPAGATFRINYRTTTKTLPPGFDRDIRVVSEIKAVGDTNPSNNLRQTDGTVAAP